MSEERRPHKNQKVGEVVSTKMEKTIVVEVEEDLLKLRQVEELAAV